MKHNYKTYIGSLYQSVLSTSFIHHSGAAYSNFSRRGPKHNSEKGNTTTEPIRRDEESSFAIDVKGGGRTNSRRKSKQQEKEKANRESGLPSMPKGETVGNIVIDGKGGNTQAKGAALKQRKAKEAQ